MAKGDGTDEPLGFITCINLHKHAKSPAVKKVKKFLLSKAPAKEKQHLARLLEDRTKQVGLIISDRMINFPVELVGDSIIFNLK